MRRIAMGATSMLIAFSASFSSAFAHHQPIETDPSIRPTLGDTLSTGSTAHQQVTAQVWLSNRGPFPFLVDTGAEKTIIADELARSLGLGEGRAHRIMTIDRTAVVTSAIIHELRFGNHIVKHVTAPRLSASAIGADGILGIDLLQSFVVSFDFRMGAIAIEKPALESLNSSPDTIVVTGKRLRGRLIIKRASVEGKSVGVIIDTGSDATIANSALRKLLNPASISTPSPVTIHTALGTAFQTNEHIVRSLRIGSVEMSNVPMIFYDSQVFQELGFTRKPAIILGMDSLRAFERVVVDFPRRRISFSGETLRPTGNDSPEFDAPKHAARRQQ